MSTAPENFGLKKNRPLEFKQSFVKHTEIHFRHFLPVRKHLFVGYPCVVLESFFLQRVGKIIFQWRPRSLCCSVNTCRCVFAKFFQMGRILNYQQVRQVWKLGALHYYSRDFSIMETSSASAIPSSRRGRAPSSSPSSLTLSAFLYSDAKHGAWYLVSSATNYKLPALIFAKSFSFCNAVADFLTRASKPNVKTSWKGLLRVEYSPQKSMYRHCWEMQAKLTVYTFQQPLVSTS